LEGVRSVPASSDEGALIEAIAAAPFDDAPRLVYADWLQERGDDARSQYLRTVVRLMHAPEDRTDVDLCSSLAEGLDAGWRQRVGGRFEVLLEGSKPVMLFAHALRAVLKIVQHEAVNLLQFGQPVCLQSEVTREAAEEFMSSFGTRVLSENPDGEPPLKLSVRLMRAESGPTLFAPRK